MIRIQKPATPPEKLTQDGKKKRRSHCSSYSRNPSAYQSGDKKFAFDRNIYAHESVKQSLIKAQHSKCCFCERLIGTDGDIEHFRPKQACSQSIGKPLQRPGYYWLAYEWANLYLACSGCNQRHKQNLFPLQNPDQRASSHHQPIDAEQPLFIDPGNDDPEQLIGFRGEIAYAIEGNLRGQTTLDALKLNQRSLPELRLQRLQELKLLHQTVMLAEKQPENIELQALAKEAQIMFKKLLQNEAEFASASRCAANMNFHYVI